MNAVVLVRLARRLEHDERGCWIFPGTTVAGYGQIMVEGSMRYTHRLTYEHFVGPIPADWHVDHLCRNKACCNPNHLEAVTPLVNNRRSSSPTAINAGKTHCIRGHEYTEANTVRRPSRPERRECRVCRALMKRRWDQINRPRPAVS